MIVVLDTNVLVSAAINPNGPPAEIIRAWMADSFTWVASVELIAEMERAFANPKVNRYFAWNKDEVAEFLRTIRQAVKVAAPTQRLDVITTDPDDNRVLEAAAAGQADYIVTGDSDLLSLGRYENVQIVTPARFTVILARMTL